MRTDAVKTEDIELRLLLEAIYQKYVGDSAKNAQGIPLDNNVLIRRYFSAGLARLMNDIRRLRHGLGCGGECQPARDQQPRVEAA